MTQGCRQTAGVLRTTWTLHSFRENVAGTAQVSKSAPAIASDPSPRLTSCSSVFYTPTPVAHLRASRRLRKAFQALRHSARRPQSTCRDK
eukprot:3523357-Pleurochrysis_carterae.AAC.1